MKLKIVFLTVLMLLGCVTAGAEKKENAGKPCMEFPVMVWDFGTIEESRGPVSHSFEVINSGDAPLVILNASASCGCTRPEYPKKPIQAGKKDRIKVTYNPAGRPGEFTKNVTVRSNDKRHKRVTLKIKGFVNPAKK